jgi:hypothetical protein
LYLLEGFAVEVFKDSYGVELDGEVDAVGKGEVGVEN